MPKLQFSLRTLLIVITALGVSWGLTISWGIPDVTQMIDSNWQSDSQRVEQVSRSEFDADGKLTWNGVRSPPAPWHFIGNGSAPAPFIVGVDVECMIEHESGDPRANFGSGDREYFFWFFGLKVRLGFLRQGYWF